MSPSTTKLPIGEEFFDDMILGNNYYVDKTLFIKDILDNGAKFTLCTRPRRFGKTLNQTMLKCFFEDTAPLSGKDTRSLFNGLKIEAAGDTYMDHQGKYPVIFMSFAGVEENNFAANGDIFKKLISKEFIRHKYVMKKIADEEHKEKYKALCSENGKIEIYKQPLSFLCKCLEDYHGKKAIILIDEYDVPLQNAWVRGFYDDMIDFVRPFMKDALKGNEYLQFAVITGCLRVSKESIFTGLNNADVVSIASNRYSDYFGFTQAEVDAMLGYYNLENKTQIIKDWYNGYIFGEKEIYNPWSLIKYVNDLKDNPNSTPEPYWASTSGNSIVRQLIDRTKDSSVKDDLETLLSGGAISKVVREDIVYGDIDKHADNLWNMLFFTGYLKKVGERLDDVEKTFDLSIPNREVKYIYKTQIKDWFNEKVEEKDYGRFFEAILNGNAEVVQEELNDMLLDSISYMDGKEDFYHGLIVGALSKLQKYAVRSNRETGRGRCDIVLKHLLRRDKAVLMELKWTDDNKSLKKECDAALKQIEDNEYAHELQSEGYTDITKYGIAFCGKYCEVKVGRKDA